MMELIPYLWKLVHVFSTLNSPKTSWERLSEKQELNVERQRIWDSTLAHFNLIGLLHISTPNVLEAPYFLTISYLKNLKLPFSLYRVDAY